MAGWNISMPNAVYYDPTTPGLQALVNEAMAQDEIAIDTETTGLVSWKEKVLYWSVSWPGKRVTLNVSTLHWFREVFADPTKTWIFANAKFDLHMLANMGVELAGKIACTQVMHSLLYEDRPHRLKMMARHILGWTYSDFQDTFGKIGKATGLTPTDVIRKAERENFGLLVEYAANDAYATWELWVELRKQLQNNNTYSLYGDTPPFIRTLWDLFTIVEMPYTRTLYRCERRGIMVNIPYLEEITPKVIEQMGTLDKKIAHIAGRIINTNSPQQLQQLLFGSGPGDLGLQPIKMTKGGKSGVRNPSADKDVRAKLAEDNPVVGLLDERIKLGTFYSNFLMKMQHLVDPFGLIHTSFNQDVTRTGRLSSSDPNMQNIPTLEKDVWELRKAFLPRCKENVIIAGDYSQLEMRLVAAGSMSKDMIDVFLRGWDIHMGNASLMFGIPYDEIAEAKLTDKMVKAGELDESSMTERIYECLAARAAAKNIGFGMNYGMGPKKLANDLGVPIAEAKNKIALYKKTYPAVDDFYAEAIRECEETGYAFTLLGRRRNVPEIRSRSNSVRSQAERIAVNTPIQGSAADITKMAQLRLDESGMDRDYDYMQLLQIHDEIVGECPKECAEEARVEKKDWMENSLYSVLPVPLTANVGIGPSWGQAH